MVRILVADDHDDMRVDVITVLSRRPDWQVVGEASNGREAVSLAIKLKPDIAIMDVHMPELDGVEATRQIRKAVPQTEVIACSVDATEQTVRGLLTAGVRGYVMKANVWAQLLEAVEKVSQGRLHFTSKVQEQVLHSFHVDARGIVLEHASLGTGENPGAPLIAGRELKSIFPWASEPDFEFAFKSAIGTTKVSSHFEFKSGAPPRERVTRVNIIAVGDKTSWIFISHKPWLNENGSCP